MVVMVGGWRSTVVMVWVGGGVLGTVVMVGEGYSGDGG